MKYTRRSPVEWQVVSDNRWFAFYFMRSMVPVEKVRNPFAGRHAWKVKLGKLKVDWN
jgi:hypothetical protein